MRSHTDNMKTIRKINRNEYAQKDSTCYQTFFSFKTYKTVGT